MYSHPHWRCLASVGSVKSSPKSPHRLPLIRLTCQDSLPAKSWLCLVSHPDNPGEQHQEINKISPAGPEHTTLRLHNRGRIENQQQRKPKVSLIKIWSTHFSSELNYRSPVVTIMTRMIITSWFTVYPCWISHGDPPGKVTHIPLNIFFVRISSVPPLDIISPWYKRKVSW